MVEPVHPNIKLWVEKLVRRPLDIGFLPEHVLLASQALHQELAGLGVKGEMFKVHVALNSNFYFV